MAMKSQFIDMPRTWTMIKLIGMSLWVFMMIEKRKTVGLMKMRDEWEK